MTQNRITHAIMNLYAEDTMKTWPINTQRFSGIAECLYENYEKVKGLYPYDGLDPEAADRRIPGWTPIPERSGKPWRPPWRL